MNKQMTLAEIERFTDAYGCGLARTNRRSVVSVKETFTGLDKFDTLLGPHERPYACTGIGAWAAPVTRQNLPISDKATLVGSSEVGAVQSAFDPSGHGKLSLSLYRTIDGNWYAPQSERKRGDVSSSDFWVLQRRQLGRWLLAHSNRVGLGASVF